jgi:hypothetical protein
VASIGLPGSLTNFGDPVLTNVTLQYHLFQYFWPEFDLNWGLNQGCSPRPERLPLGPKQLDRWGWLPDGFDAKSDHQQQLVTTVIWASWRVRNMGRCRCWD